MNLFKALLLALLIVGIAVNVAWHKQHKQMLCLIGTKVGAFNCP